MVGASNERRQDLLVYFSGQKPIKLVVEVRLFLGRRWLELRSQPFANFLANGTSLRAVDGGVVHGRTASHFDEIETVAFGYLCERLFLNSGPLRPLAIRYMRRHKRRATVSCFDKPEVRFWFPDEKMKITAGSISPCCWQERQR
jgi:hypothetical protein